MGKLGEIKELYGDHAHNLAKETERWAIANGCFRGEDGSIGGYFIIRPSENPHNEKPIWSTHFNEQPEEWGDVRDKMVELKIPIARDALNGWYIGHRGEQMTIVNTISNYTHTHAQTARRTLDLIIMTNELPYAEKYFVLKGDLRELTVRALHGKLSEFVGDDQLSFGELLLRSGDEGD